MVLAPLVLIYEDNRRAIIETRVAALLDAGSGLIRLTLEEIAGDTALIADQLEAESALEPGPSLTTILRASLLAYPRYARIEVIDAGGDTLAQVSRAAEQQSSRAAIPSLSATWNEAIQASRALQTSELWLSPVLWSQDGLPAILIARSLLNEDGLSQGTLLSIANLDGLAREFDRSVNASPELQLSYLLSGEGQTLNPLARQISGPSFASRYPDVWEAMQRESRGVIATDHGIFLYLADQLLPAAKTKRDGLFLYDYRQRQARLGVVVNIPADALLRNSPFRQPLGVAVVALPYLLAAVASMVISRGRSILASSRQQQQASLERLEALMGNAGIGMGSVDPHSGRFIEVNPALCQFFGRSVDELLRCSWQDLTYADDIGIAQRQTEALISGEINSFRQRQRYRRRDGTIVWGDLTVTCTREADGTVREVIGQVTDVSELVAKSAYLEAASQAGVIGVWDWDVTSNKLSWDQVMYRLYGLNDASTRQTMEIWQQAIHPDDRERVMQDVQAALHGYRPFQPRFRIIWPDGSIHTLQSRSRTTYGADGNALRIIGVNYDITEQVEREEEALLQRQLLATTIEALVDPLIVLKADKRGKLRVDDINPATASFFECSASRLIGLPIEQLLPTEANAAIHQALGALATADGATAESTWLADDHPLRLADCQSEPVYVDVRAVRGRTNVVLSFRDVTERRQSLADLQASEARFRLVAENVSDVIFLAQAGRITWISPALLPALGWQPRQWVDAGLDDFCHPDDQSQVVAELAQAEAGETIRLRLRARASDEVWHWLELHAAPCTGNSGLPQVVGSFHLVDAEVEAEQHLNHRATRDALTGLLNRQEILDQLQRLSHHRRHNDGGLAVLFCDIDHFKTINDTHGHSGGDAVLKALAERLQQSTRQGDLVGRLGGDELLVVLPSVADLAEAEVVASKVHAAACIPLHLPTGEVQPTLSIGVTLMQADEAITAVIERADQAMYAAKQRGRNRVILIHAEKEAC